LRSAVALVWEHPAAAVDLRDHRVDVRCVWCGAAVTR
jgi:hypothetical protein